jgi:hypothetical protein
MDWAAIVLTGVLDDLKWVAEARMLELCAIRRSTYQSWVRAGILEALSSYGEGDVIEVALVALLRDHFPLNDLAERWRQLRNDGSVAGFLVRARQLEDSDRFDLVIEPAFGGITVVADDAALVQAVRHADAPRTVLVLPLAARLRAIRDAYRAFATTAKRPGERKAGRPVHRQAGVESVGRGS